jgi:hypothetical protein
MILVKCKQTECAIKCSHKTNHDEIHNCTKILSACGGICEPIEDSFIHVNPKTFLETDKIIAIKY